MNFFFSESVACAAHPPTAAIPKEESNIETCRLLHPCHPCHALSRLRLGGRLGVGVRRVGARERRPFRHLCVAVGPATETKTGAGWLPACLPAVPRESAGSVRPRRRRAVSCPGRQGRWRHSSDGKTDGRSGPRAGEGARSERGGGSFVVRVRSLFRARLETTVGRKRSAKSRRGVAFSEVSFLLTGRLRRQATDRMQGRLKKTSQNRVISMRFIRKCGNLQKQTALATY